MTTAGRSSPPGHSATSTPVGAAVGAMPGLARSVVRAIGRRRHRTGFVRAVITREGPGLRPTSVVSVSTVCPAGTVCSSCRGCTSVTVRPAGAVRAVITREGPGL
eukprot:Hpha_TRINITY_DN16693_c2_g2::TRINITY_DN16693_c2_g2_i2::g.180616::m.180616